MCRSRCRCKSAHVSTTRCAKAENNDATRIHRDAPRLCSSRTGSQTLPEPYLMVSWSLQSAQEVRQRAARCCSPNPFSSHTSIALPYHCIACGSCCSSSALNRASCGCLPLRQLHRGSYTAVSAASALLRLSVRPRRLGCVSFYTSVHPSATKSIHYVLCIDCSNAQQIPLPRPGSR